MRAAEAIGWNTAFDVSRLERDIGLTIRAPVDMMYDYLGINIMLAESQIKQGWKIVAKEIFKIGYKAKFLPLRAAGEFVGVQIRIVKIRLEGGLRKIELHEAAREASSRKGAAICKQRRASKKAA